MGARFDAWPRATGKHARVIGIGGAGFVAALGLTALEATSAARTRQAGAAPAGRAGEVQVANGRVTHPGLGYSFILPPDWILRPVPVACDVEVSDRSRSSRFMLRVDRATDTLTHEFQVFGQAQILLGGWLAIKREWTRVGGVRAGLIEGIRDRVGEPARHEWNVVLLRRSRRYTMQFVAPESEARAAAGIVGSVLASFRWERK